MKKLVVIALVFCTVFSFAQEQDTERVAKFKERMAKSSPEDRAEMQTKRMTLQLDLTEEQQEQVSDVLTKHFKANEEKFKADKKSRKDMTDEERKAMKMAMLDSQIELKGKMKEILNEEQYEKYSATLDRYMKKRKGGKGKMKKQ